MKWKFWEADSNNNKAHQQQTAEEAELAIASILRPSSSGRPLRSTTNTDGSHLSSSNDLEKERLEKRVVLPTTKPITMSTPDLPPPAITKPSSTINTEKSKQTQKLTTHHNKGCSKQNGPGCFPPTVSPYLEKNMFFESARSEMFRKNIFFKNGTTNHARA